eukprot:gnl/MRDRNA2_/MRDRNA2_101751_c0_seq1.p1 gnl/MRDRNA2_/MRDRNA2_101751_c0~~gnl/MRDRNA2_/MRDRNA2_101751_c0_seq1.p1  ORF type:complete len:288 (-),score=57.19 gnl/MRDRNA2_/MRDRNA2_101751_c0_seq1:115-978(-)
MRPTVLTEHPVFLERIAAALEAAVAVAEGRSECPSTPFDSVSVPHQSLAAYVRQMGRRLRCGREVFTLALVYCERAAVAGIPCRGTSAHRLYLCALVLAAKFLEDGTPGNDFFAKCGGISASELCFLELQCLDALGYRLHVDHDCFKACDAALTDGQCNSQVVLATVAEAAAAKGFAKDTAGKESNAGASGRYVADDSLDAMKTLPMTEKHDVEMLSIKSNDMSLCQDFSTPLVKDPVSAPALQRDAASNYPTRAGEGCCRRDDFTARAVPRRRNRTARRFSNYGGA